MTQQIINVGAAPNDGQGDPIRTAFTKCNNNFDELYARSQSSPPPTLVGSVGDVEGMTAYDENFYYYCFQNFDGSSQIWNKVPQTGNAQVTILTATGNVTGNYFIGNGRALTGVIASASNTIVSGNSSVFISSVTGNIKGVLNGNVVLEIGPYLGVVPLLSFDGVVYAANSFYTNAGVSANTIVTANGNITGGNIISNSVIQGTSLSLSGNVTSNLNLSLNSTIGGNLTVIGNISGDNEFSGNVTAQNITAVGNITSTGGYFVGDGGFLSNVTAVSNVAVTQIANGTSSFAVASSGGNISATVGGTANVLLLKTTGANVTGYIGVTGNVDGANVNSSSRIIATGNITGGNLITGGKVSASSNIDGVNFNASQQVIATGNITGGNLITGGLINATGNISGGNLSGTLITGTLTTGSQPNITAIGTLSSLTVSGNINTGSGATTINSLITTTGNITGGNLITAGLGSFGTTVTATGNITGGNLITTGLIDSTGNVTGGNLNTGGRILATGNITGGNLTTGGLIVTTGNINANNVVSTSTISATGNISGGNLSVNSGSISAGTLTVSNILNGGANATGNIGNSTTYFNTVFATATRAQYADLAENYLADADYAPGTVLSFGGTAEVTESTQDLDPLIIGVVSTQPAYQMNSRLEGEYVTTVALAGRVPCKVQGPITRGAMMVSAGNGVARAETQPLMGTVIGKALEDFDGDQGIIEIVVGRL